MAESDEVGEILEFAINREIEANELYLTLASRMATPALRRLFEDLAAEELEHKAKLELEVIKIGRVVKEAPRPPDARRRAELKISEYMVDMGDELDLEFEDVLLLGMKKEKAAFRLYIDLAAMIDDPDTHETLLELAEEEARHKMRFEIEYDRLLLRRNGE
jgi:rubrerythrin